MSPSDRARQIVANALHVDVTAVPADADVATLTGWDSIAHVNIMMVLEELAAGQLTSDDVGNLFSVAAISAFLASLAASGANGMAQA